MSAEHDKLAERLRKWAESYENAVKGAIVAVDLALLRAAADAIAGLSAPDVFDRKSSAAGMEMVSKDSNSPSPIAPSPTAGSTPETDALADKARFIPVAAQRSGAIWNLARKLERERNDAREVAAANLKLVDELRVQLATAERERLGYKTAWDQGEAYNHKLEARLAEAERDAARYRWLRAGGTGPGHGVIDWEPLGELFDEKFDAAIDAAIAREQT